MVRGCQALAKAVAAIGASHLLPGKALGLSWHLVALQAKSKCPAGCLEEECTSTSMALLPAQAVMCMCPYNPYLAAM